MSVWVMFRINAAVTFSALTLARPQEGTVPCMESVEKQHELREIAVTFQITELSFGIIILCVDSF